MFNKKIITGVMAFAVATTTYSCAFAYTPIGEYYHIPADRMETDNFWDVEVKSNYLQEDKFLEDKIQAPLIKFNPQKLKKAYSKYEDGLKGVYINSVGDTMDSNVSGSNYGGGYISLTKGSLLVNSGSAYKSCNGTTTPKDYNIYALSAIASDYAHECGHWYYDDALSKRDWGQTAEQTAKDSFALEARADAFGIRLLENVPQFSVGGDLISVYRMARYDGWDTRKENHPTNNSRWNATYNYIREMSKNRVGYENDNDTYNNADSSTFYVRLKNEDKYWEIKVPDQYELANFANANYKRILYNSADRAKYVMGQVAWAIKNNCWDKNHIAIYKAQEIFNDMPETPFIVYAICVEKNKNEQKIIDWVVTSNEEENSVDFYTESQNQQVNEYISALFDSLDS